MQELISLIKDKAELKSLDDNYVSEKVLEYLRKNPKTKNKFENSKNVEQFSRSKEFNIMKKEIRKVLRESYGVFSLDNNYNELLDEFKKTKDPMLIREMLATHQSSKERLPYYNGIYKSLFKITGEPNSIFDIGCGFNPLSYSLLGYKPKYYCSDISSQDMSFIKKFFEISKIDGETFTNDAVNNAEELIKLVKEKKPDIIFMFKLLDTLEAVKRHNTKKLLPELTPYCKFLIVSFATVSLGGGKAISDFKRTWFINYLEKNQWEYEPVKFPNEIFYVIRLSF